MGPPHYVPHLSEGDILFLVQMLLGLASALASALVLASHFLVCTISCEPVVGFIPNLHGCMIDT